MPVACPVPTITWSNSFMMIAPASGVRAGGRGPLLSVRDRRDNYFRLSCRAPHLVVADAGDTVPDYNSFERITTSLVICMSCIV